jgi:hypothetical protein
MTWGTVTNSISATTTLLSDLNCVAFTWANGNAWVLNGLFNVNISTHITGQATGTCQGTATLIMTGTGTVSGVALGLSNSLTFNSAGTITISGTLVYSAASGGTIKWIAGTMVVTGSTLSLGASCSLDTSGMVWENMTLRGSSQTYTMISAIFMTGNLISAGTTAANFAGAFSVTVGGSLTCTTTTTTGSAIILNGTGTWSGAGTLRNNLTINTAGTITVSGTVLYNTGTLTYTAGTVITTSSTLSMAISTTLNTNGMTWNNITQTAVLTLTLTSDLNMNGTLNSVSGIFTINGNTIYLASISAAASGVVQGTTTLVFNKPGSWASAGAGASYANPIGINTSGTTTITGTFTLSGSLNYSGGTVVTAGSTLKTSSSILNTAGIVFTDMNITPGTSVVTLNSLLTVTGTTTIAYSSGAAQNFSGTSGFITRNLVLSNTLAAMNLILMSGVTYTVQNSFTSTSTLALPLTMKSNATGIKSFFVLGNGATQDIDFLSATDIDSSAGATIWSYKGTLSNTNNWGIMVAQKQLTNTY